MPRRSPTPTQRICHRCGSEFLGNTIGRYCSAVCKKEANAEAAKQKVVKSPAANKTCMFCGDEFTPVRRSQKFCSKKCSSHYQTKKVRKEKPDHCRSVQRQWQQRNRDTTRRYSREYASRNRTKLTESVRVRRHTDHSFRIASQLRGRLRSAVRAQGTIKVAGLWDILGCDKVFLMNHLSSQFTEGMSFANYGEWHIDHIRPCASFDLTDPEQQKECFHYSNLQPLWAADNFQKSDKVLAA
jgi:hypothetical protein